MELTADRYRYLEDGGDPATRAWTQAQNERARAYLDALPQRAALAEHFAAALSIGYVGAPTVRAGRAFFIRRSGEQDQAVLALREAGAERVLLDPTELDPSGLTALDWWYPSPEGRFVAAGLSRNGDEHSTLYLLDVERAEISGETIPNTRYCALAWLPDERGFYYTRYPVESNYDEHLFFHELGTRWQDDSLVFGEGRPREEYLAVALSDDGRWLVVCAYTGWVRNDVYLCDRTASQAHRFTPLVEGREAIFEVSSAGDGFVVRSNEDAPRYRIFAFDPHDAARERWRALVAERDDVLKGVAPLQGGLVLHYLHDVRSRLSLRTDDGFERALELSGSVIQLGANPSAPEAYVLHEGFVDAPAVERIALGASVRLERWDGVAAPFDSSAYAVNQEWFVSKDGTRVPMFVIARAGLARDGRAPAVLHGYGGFDIALVPSFAPHLVPWLDAGGVYAVANLRGGGEFGEAWHRAGMRERKQNVFDDFIAAAEHLAASGIADPARLGIVGGSNGGLLVAAAMVQRPELFRAVICAVPLTDMLRFAEFSIARLWLAEYGDPADPVDAAVLRAYSPYHNLADGVAYPATLVLTAESDARVDPMHARKFAARLQEATGGQAPILLHVEPQAGHGAGKPRRKQIEELADRWSFLFANLGLSCEAARPQPV
ncbi:MAG: prolyl oligopeptidase family serine peptidase [Vulcanimicrobiaceae bacterium]